MVSVKKYDSKCWCILSSTWIPKGVLFLIFFCYQEILHHSFFRTGFTWHHLKQNYFQFKKNCIQYICKLKHVEIYFRKIKQKQKQLANSKTLTIKYVQLLKKDNLHIYSKISICFTFSRKRIICILYLLFYNSNTYNSKV